MNRSLGEFTTDVDLSKGDGEWFCECLRCGFSVKSPDEPLFLHDLVSAHVCDPKNKINSVTV